MAYKESILIRGTATRREKYYIHNSLVAIPLMLINHSVLIDLRNETSVAGRISYVDGYMNVTLKEAVFIDQKGLQYEFDDFMVTARMLRHIHLPDSVDIMPELRKFLETIGAKPKGEKKGRSLKVKRATESHKQTVKELND